MVTLNPGKEKKVKFNVQFITSGTATLQARLSPGDSNPSNDTLTKSVNVKTKDNGKDKDKDKDKNQDKDSKDKNDKEKGQK
jgi:hypothetical protein